jgi:ribose transport system permease protein
MTDTAIRPAPLFRRHSIADFLRAYGVVIIIVLLMVVLSFVSPSFLTPRNLLNILSQSAPLGIIAASMTLVIISGNFDLSIGAIVSVASVTSAALTLVFGANVGMAVAPLVGVLLGVINGAVITGFSIHSFLATLATSMVFQGVAVMVTGGALIPVSDENFAWLGRGRWGMVNIAIGFFVVFVALMMFLLNRTTFGRRVFAVGGNEEAAILSGVRTKLVKIAVFGINGFAAGIAGVIIASRVSMGQPQAGVGMELNAIAAVILGGTSIYGGAGAVWRSFAGVVLLALIGNGFNLINVNPFYKDLTTGLIIVIAVALSAGKNRR